MGARFELVDNGVELWLGDRLILRHLASAPTLRCAVGRPSVTMVRGNFALSDDPVDAHDLTHASPCPETGDMLFAVDKHGPPLFRMSLNISGSPVGGAQLRITPTPAASGIDRLTIDLIAEPGETVWGGGEQMSYLALNGRAFPMWTSEPGVGREPGTPFTELINADGSGAGGDYWTTNYPQPTFLSSRLYACHLDCARYSVLDFSDPARHRLHLWQADAHITLTPGDSIADLVSRLSSALGRQPHLPDWAIGGAIIGLKDGSNSFDRLERIIAAGAEVSGLWCEDWVGIRQTSFGRRLFWDWQWNPARYPDLPARIADLKARGIRFLGYTNPYLAADGPQYAEAAAQGFLARQLDSDRPYLVDFGEFDAGVVDFTNPAASAWFAETIIGRQMLDFGLDGWMADFGEYLPVDLALHDGDPMEMHNRWPVLWAEVNARAVASRGRTGDALFFMRAGFSGVQAHCPLVWAGDQSVDFSRHDGIGTVITAALSAGLVGNAYSHSDVGGYTSLHGNVRTPELMHRWFELGAFTPVMRTHEGNRPDDNLQIDSTPELLADFARWTRVHAALAPYVRQLCIEAQDSGLPVQRPLFLHYPDDPRTHTVQDQYLYGADLLVAPVIQAGAGARDVLLPGDGDWLHVWTGQRFAAGEHPIDAPLGSPPVFFRPDSVFAPLFASLPARRDARR